MNAIVKSTGYDAGLVSLGKAGPGADTVNTVQPATLKAFLDHGMVRAAWLSCNRLPEF